jgi:hypothetical protein
MTDGGTYASRQKLPGLGNKKSVIFLKVGTPVNYCHIASCFIHIQFISLQFSPDLTAAAYMYSALL